MTISHDSDFGLNARTIGFEQQSIADSTTNDRLRTYSIEARDMFVAIHVATPELVASEERELKFSKDRSSAQIDDYLLLISREKCTDSKLPCRPTVGVAKSNSYGPQLSRTAQTIGFDVSASLALPVPVADGHGGLEHVSKMQI